MVPTNVKKYNIPSVRQLLLYEFTFAGVASGSSDYLELDLEKTDGIAIEQMSTVSDATVDFVLSKSNSLSVTDEHLYNVSLNKFFEYDGNNDMRFILTNPEKKIYLHIANGDTVATGPLTVRIFFGALRANLLT